jgi:hypothetical protein
MNRGDVLNGLEFQEELILDNDVRLESLVQSHIVPNDRNWFLGLDPQTALLQFIDHDGMIDRFKQSGPELSVNMEGHIDHDLCKFVFCHDGISRKKELTQRRKGKCSATGGVI